MASFPQGQNISISYAPVLQMHYSRKTQLKGLEIPSILPVFYFWRFCLRDCKPRILGNWFYLINSYTGWMFYTRKGKPRGLGVTITPQGQSLSKGDTSGQVDHSPWPPTLLQWHRGSAKGKKKALKMESSTDLPEWTDFIWNKARESSHIWALSKPVEILKVSN